MGCYTVIRYFRARTLLILVARVMGYCYFSVFDLLGNSSFGLLNSDGLSVYVSDFGPHM